MPRAWIALALLPGIAVASPDLTVHDVSAPAFLVQGDRPVVTAEVANEGTSEATSVEVGLAWVRANGTANLVPACLETIDAIETGTFALVTFACDVVIPGEGPGVVAVVADPGELIAESDETDNVGITATWYASVPRAELGIVSSNPPLFADPGTPFDIPLAVHNRGRVRAQATRVRARISTDRRYELADPVLCDGWAPALEPGADATVTLSGCAVPLTAARGDGHVISRVDALGQVDEWIDDDNDLAVPIRVADVGTPGAITFTGDATADFATVPTTRLVDGATPDMPPAAAWTTGFDLRQAVFAYDGATDTLHVGLVGWPDRSTGDPIVIGDADGDGDPSAVSPGWAFAGTDAVRLGTGESAVIRLRVPRLDGFADVRLRRTIAGVAYNTGLAGATFAYDTGGDLAGASFGATIPGATIVRGVDPVLGRPDLEFAIRPFLETWNADGDDPTLALFASAVLDTVSFDDGGLDTLPDGDADVRLCLGDARDDDGDGFAHCDCDDDDPTAFPGAHEVCDGVDNDCDGFDESILGLLDCVIDPDNDGLSSSKERNLGTDPDDPDSDGDGLLDGVEVDDLLTNPNEPDSDGGGVDDGDELAAGTDPLVAADDDVDGDGLGVVDEAQLSTDPDDPDSDDDGLLDGDEGVLGTLPRVPDTDGDGLDDGFEVVMLGTDPTDEDSDGGGDDDGDEHMRGTDPLDPGDDDPDGDGLDNATEAALGTRPDHADSDGDGVDDDVELDDGTNPLDPDTDGGGDTDGEERANGTNPLAPSDDDPDDDGLTNGQEFQLGTEPRDPDSDGDGLDDGEEVLGADGIAESGDETDPLSDDTDGDGLTDGDEVDGTGPLAPWGPTNPVARDTDGGGTEDGDEVAASTDPTDPDDDDPDGDGLDNATEDRLGTNPDVADTDDDGLDDGEEIAAGTDPTDPDTDGDGLDDGEEIAAGTDPGLADSDGGGVDDGQELVDGTDPTDPTDDLAPDRDGDGLSDAAEETLGTDPDDPDTDGDGVDDGAEVAAGTDPLVAEADRPSDDALTADAAPSRWFCSTGGGDPAALWVLGVVLLGARRQRRVRATRGA